MIGKFLRMISGIVFVFSCLLVVPVFLGEVETLFPAFLFFLLALGIFALSSPRKVLRAGSAVAKASLLGLFIIFILGFFGRSGSPYSDKGDYAERD